MDYISDNRSYDPETKELKYLGRGMYFPLQATPDTGSTRQAWCMLDNYAKIAQSIMQILGTPIGSRYMLRAFGSNLGDLVFEPMDTSLQARLITEIADPLRRWEKRIRDIIVESTISESENKFSVNVRFSIIGTGAVASLVFPYYHNSGLLGDIVTYEIQET